MFSLFARARAGAALAPAERMALKAIQAGAAALVAFIVANAPAIQTAIQGGGVDVWQLAGNQLVVPLIMAIFLTGYKFFSAQRDGSVPTAPASGSASVPVSVSDPAGAAGVGGGML